METKKLKNKFAIIKNLYILSLILNYLPNHKFLNILKYNKNLQNRLKVNIFNFKNVL